MEIDAFNTPRRFPVGEAEVELCHVANIILEPDEMVTFVGPGNRQYDVTSKDWGYYATPSVGKRLRHFGIRAGLMRNVDSGHVFVVLVFEDRMSAWQHYMEVEREELVMWLDEIPIS